MDGDVVFLLGCVGAMCEWREPNPHPHPLLTGAYVMVIDGNTMFRAVNLRGEVFGSTVIPANPPGGPPP